MGSAINNTIRQVGSARSVAVLGSVLSARYASSSTPALKGLPAPAVAAARRSVGAATQVAARLGPSGTLLLVGLGFVLAGALVALLFLPATPRLSHGYRPTPHHPIGLGDRHEAAHHSIETAVATSASCAKPNGKGKE